ncbi:hypothetical protein J6590_054452 [Homalodisca vitripennis]|nr:hypothetical protein J6590_054452 [Homalodisca vitripennis]
MEFQQKVALAAKLTRPDYPETPSKRIFHDLSAIQGFSASCLIEKKIYQLALLPWSLRCLIFTYGLANSNTHRVLSIFDLNCLLRLTGKSPFNYSEYERKTKRKARGKGTMTQCGGGDAFSVIVLRSIGANVNCDGLADSVYCGS